MSAWKRGETIQTNHEQNNNSCSLVDKHHRRSSMTLEILQTEILRALVFYSSACPRWTHGSGCSEECDCIREHSAGCDPKMGSCICKPAYHGSQCEKGIIPSQENGSQCHYFVRPQLSQVQSPKFQHITFSSFHCEVSKRSTLFHSFRVSVALASERQCTVLKCHFEKLQTVLLRVCVSHCRMWAGLLWRWLWADLRLPKYGVVRPQDWGVQPAMPCRP